MTTWYVMVQTVSRSCDSDDMICDVSNCFPDTWLWRHGIWWFKLQAGHVTVMIWYVMVQTVVENVTVMAWYEMAQTVIFMSWYVMAQTVTWTRDCDEMVGDGSNFTWKRNCDLIVGDGSNCYLDTWLWWHGMWWFKLLAEMRQWWYGVWWFKLLAGYVTVMTRG